MRRLFEKVAFTVRECSLKSGKAKKKRGGGEVSRELQVTETAIYSQAGDKTLPFSGTEPLPPTCPVHLTPRPDGEPLQMRCGSEVPQLDMIRSIPAGELAQNKKKNKK